MKMNTFLVKLYMIWMLCCPISCLDMSLGYHDAPFRRITATGRLRRRNTTCILEYSTIQYQNYFFLHAHIPKTGGTTIYRCFTEVWDPRHTGGIIQGVLSPGTSKSTLCRNVVVDSVQNNPKMKYLSCEIYGNGDFQYILSAVKRTNVIPFTMIRHPVDYIFSAFGHHAKVRPSKACQNFNQIILTDQSPNSTQQCARYDMRNLQTRSLSNSPLESFEPGTLGPANITQAISVLRDDMFFVGITAYFRASMCLFSYQMGQLHLHPHQCDCRNLDSSTKLLKGSMPTNPQHIVSPEAMAILRSSYINLDEILYNFALDLFISRIIMVERKTNQVLLCSHTDGEAIMARKLILQNQHQIDPEDVDPIS